MIAVDFLDGVVLGFGVGITALTVAVLYLTRPKGPQ